MPIKREIVYPFFLECCQFTDDVFWENVFDDLAHGKAPYGTYISRDFLCSTNKNTAFSYKIERKDAEHLYNDILDILTNKIGIQSQKQKDCNKLAFRQLEKNIRDTNQDWNSIRKKSVKESLYENFVLEMKVKYSLDIEQCKRLLATIFICVMFKTITAKDILYEDGKITEIKGITFSQGKFKITKPLYSGNVKIKEEIEDTIRRMSEAWPKFLESLRS